MRNPSGERRSCCDARSRPDCVFDGGQPQRRRASRSASSPTSARSTTRTSTSTRGKAPRTAPPRSAATPKAATSAVSADIGKNIQAFVDQKYDIIVTVGFAAGADTIKAAKANPTIKFIGVDQSPCLDGSRRDRHDVRAAAGDARNAPAELPGHRLEGAAARLPRRHRRRVDQQDRHIAAVGGTDVRAGRPELHPRLQERREVGQPGHQGRRRSTSRRRRTRPRSPTPPGGKAFAQQMLAEQPGHRRHLPGRRPDRQRRPPGRLRSRHRRPSASTSTSSSRRPTSAQVHRGQRREEAQEERLGRDRAHQGQDGQGRRRSSSTSTTDDVGLSTVPRLREPDHGRDPGRSSTTRSPR